MSKNLSLMLPILLSFLASSSIHWQLMHCLTIMSLLNPLVLSHHRAWSLRILAQKKSISIITYTDSSKKNANFCFGRETAFRTSCMLVAVDWARRYISISLYTYRERCTVWQDFIKNNLKLLPTMVKFAISKIMIRWVSNSGESKLILSLYHQKTTEMMLQYLQCCLGDDNNMSSLWEQEVHTIQLKEDNTIIRQHRCSVIIHYHKTVFLRIT